jgi:hypothetical protein
MFVQSCDSLYRRLTYFRASVQNSGSLDRVLEGGINGVYYFVLALFLLSVLRFNPWSLLLSITSLLVSFSFAFGYVSERDDVCVGWNVNHASLTSSLINYRPTISKYIHGIMMIAVFRPFDLGDRVYLAPLGTVETGRGNGGNSWLVEEIHLGATKLRYGKTGETGEFGFPGGHTSWAVLGPTSHFVSLLFSLYSKLRIGRYENIQPQSNRKCVN